MFFKVLQVLSVKDLRVLLKDFKENHQVVVVLQVVVKVVQLLIKELQVEHKITPHMVLSSLEKRNLKVKIKRLEKFTREKILSKIRQLTLTVGKEILTTSQMKVSIA